METHPKVEALGVSAPPEDEVPEEMLEELEKEIARNAEATRMVKEREQEASLARVRASESHRKMHEMMSKYDHMKKKLEWTRQTLAETTTRIEQHNSKRQARIARSVTELKERTDSLCASKLAAADVKPGGEGGLTDAERALLQLCQEHRKLESAVEEPSAAPKTEAATEVNLSALAELSVTDDPASRGSERQPPAKTQQEGEEVVAMDLNATVSRMEAKCVGVREELGQMAMSEQYMRTKQAQLLAKRREKEAEEAMQLAAKKEQEAKQMRKKVMDMMRLLEERKNKLRVTECVLEKKAVVVEKVNKLLESKERRGNLLEKQRGDSLAFNRKPKSEAE